MDPLSLSASIAGLLNLTASIVVYIRETRGASEEISRFSLEATNILGLLTLLSIRIKDAQTGEPWFTNISKLNEENGLFPQLEDALKRLNSTLAPKVGLKKTVRTLTWSLVRSDVRETVDLIERLKSIINLALSDDVFSLALALRKENLAHQNQLQIELSGINDGLAGLKAHNETEESQNLVQNILQRLQRYSANLTITHDSIAPKRQKNTGDWLLNSREFLTWIDGPDQCLWCLGIPGAGKTFLASLIIDTLFDKFPETSTATIHLYLNYKDGSEQTAEKLTASLLKQLIHQDLPLSDEVQRLFETYSQTQALPPLSALVSALHAQMNQFSRVFVVVDALDECSDDESARNEFLDALKSLPDCVKWLVTSRRIYSIEEEVGDSPVLDIAAANEDVEAYIKGRMERERNLRKVLGKHEALRELVVETILGQVDGMYESILTAA
jgi:hypothetical protein